MPEDRSPSNPGSLADVRVGHKHANRTDASQSTDRPKSEGYPRDQYKDMSGINAGGRGQGTKKLNSVGSHAHQNVGETGEGKSEYGQTQIFETPGGHIVEYNDTLGSERIMIRHVSGSGIEFRSDGSCLISATNLIFDVKGNETHVVTGNSHMKVAGTAEVATGGDQVFNSGGNIIKNSGGTLVAEAAGAVITKAGGNHRTIVSGEKSETVVGPLSVMALNGMEHNVKGDATLRSEGNYSAFVSGITKLSAQKEVNITSPTATMTGDQIEVVGQYGTIGGANMIHYSYNSYVGKTLHAGDTVSTQTLRSSKTVESPYADITDVKSTHMSATTFNGDLDGIAKEALVAPNGVVTGGTFEAVSETAHVANDDDATFNATEQVVSARQKTKKKGVNVTLVDPGKYIEGSINMAMKYGMEETA